MWRQTRRSSPSSAPRNSARRSRNRALKNATTTSNARYVTLRNTDTFEFTVSTISTSTLLPSRGPVAAVASGYGSSSRVCPTIQSLTTLLPDRSCRLVQSAKLRQKRAEADASRLEAEAVADERAREHAMLLTRVHEAELSAYAGRLLVRLMRCDAMRCLRSHDTALIVGMKRSSRRNNSIPVVLCLQARQSQAAQRGAEPEAEGRAPNAIQDQLLVCWTRTRTG